MARRPSKRDLSTGILVLLLAGVLVSQALTASADHQPADKVSASGSQIEEIAPGANTLILSETLKVSTPTDLILGVTLECSIITDVTTVGNESEDTEGTIKVWVEIDGTEVPVSSDDTTDPGKVVFCNRAHRQSVNDDEDQDDDNTHETFLRTRNANAFNWLALDDGNYDAPGVPTGSTNNIVQVEVFAELTTDGTPCGNLAPVGQNCATGVIGHRTLIIEPVKAANDEQVTALA